MNEYPYLDHTNPFLSHPFRLPFYVMALDVDSPGYNCGDSDIAERWGTDDRIVDTSARANAWSSHGIVRPKMHFPAFDVDVELTDDVKAAIAAEFHVYEPRFVESCTAGHHHVFVDTPYTWDAYVEHLRMLGDKKIVEWGYVNATRDRGATFVRMSHVKKRADHVKTRRD